MRAFVRRWDICIEAAVLSEKRDRLLTEIQDVEAMLDLVRQLNER